MRRKDYELLDRNRFDEIIHNARYAHLGMVDGNIPYVIPIGFGYNLKHIYVHCASKGYKTTILKKNSQVCVNFDSVSSVKHGTAGPCSSSLFYESVICFGKAVFVEAFEEKKKALELIIKKYSPDDTREMTDKQIDQVTIIRIDIDQITGKTSKKQKTN